MPYGLIYKSCLGGTMLAVKALPGPGEDVNVVCTETLQDMHAMFTFAEQKLLSSQTPAKYSEGMIMLAAMSPQIIRLPENGENFSIYFPPDPPQHSFLFNPFKLPKFAIIAKPTIHQLIVFNMYSHLKIKLQGHLEELLKQKLNK